MFRAPNWYRMSIKFHPPGHFENRNFHPPMILYQYDLGRWTDETSSYPCY
jgi:hypothetical protein